MAPQAQAAMGRSAGPEKGLSAAEAEKLRDALRAAVRILARRGMTPAVHAALPEGERAGEEWQDAIRVWKAAGVQLERPQRFVLRCTGGAPMERAFATRELALEAAISAIEENRTYPETIEIDGRCLMDRASILRAWEERHDPG